MSVGKLSTSSEGAGTGKRCVSVSSCPRLWAAQVLRPCSAVHILCCLLHQEPVNQPEQLSDYKNCRSHAGSIALQSPPEVVQEQALSGVKHLLPAELEGAPHELLVEALKLLEGQGKAQ